MAIKLSPNPTCVLSDADNLTLEQRQKINLNLTKDIPGSDIEGDKVTVINSDGEVEMKAYSAGGGGGTEYTAGDGIDITRDTISAKIDGNTITLNASGELQASGGSASYSAGDCININNDEISVKHDSSLTNVGGRQTLTLTPSIEFNYYEQSHEQWDWTACAVTVPVPGYIGDMNFSFESWSGLNYYDMAGKMVVAIVSKPGDTTAYYVVQLSDSDGNEVYVDSYNNLAGGTYTVPSYGGRASIYIQNLSQDTDAIVDGKVTLSIGLYDTDQQTLVTDQNSQGPLYNGVPLSIFWLAQTSVTGSGQDPVEPGPDAVWRWLTNGSVPLTTTIGEGTASLSVANPLPAWDSVADEGKVLKIVSGTPTWVTP